MNIIQSVILGVLQGLTEFIPVSSSGHLVFFPSILGWGQNPLVYDLILHLGTSAALIVYFRKDLYDALFVDSRMFRFLVVGSIPAGVFGFLLGDVIEAVFRSVFFVAVFLLFGTFLMFIAEKTYKRSFFQRIKHFFGSELSYSKALMIGLFQSLAIFPGVSRSGASISAGMFAGLEREQAARFSFLLSLPVILGAGTFKIFGALADMTYMPFSSVLMGFMASFCAGLFAIKFMLKFLANGSLYVFIVYRLVLAFILFVYHFGIIS